MLPQARADQNGTAQEGKEKSCGRDHKSKMGGVHRLMHIAASKDEKKYQEGTTEAQPYDVQQPAERGAREALHIDPVAPPREGQEIHQVDGYWQNQRSKQDHDHDGRQNPGLESLTQELPASREGGRIIRRRSAPIRIEGIDISEKQAQADAQVTQEADEGEEKPEAPSGAVRWKPNSRERRNPFCSLVLTKFHMNRSAYADERLMESQDHACNEGKSEAQRWKPGRRTRSFPGSKRRECIEHEEQATPEGEGKADPQPNQADPPRAGAEDGH